jgi:hypothetical protein
MQYAYQKLMEDYGLSYNDLPEDAMHGIEAIRNIEKAINMAEKNGKTVSSKTIAKIKANDKWVVQEILDFVEDDDDNDDEMPYDEDEVIEEIKGKEKQLTQEQKFALSIESELDSMYKMGKKVWAATEIEQQSDVLFDAIKDTYHQGDNENGIETTRFSLLESPPSSFTFTLKKK